MAILKARPKVRVRVPNEIRPGDAFHATVLLDCKREVEVASVEVTLVGQEGWTLGSGKSAVTRRAEVVSLGARLSDARTLPKGRTELSVTIPLPSAAPPSYRGSAGQVEYELVVHVAVPWWPDRRARFEVLVIPLDRASPETAARVFSSKPDGPSGSEPHAELSVASTWTRVGDIVSGAFALSNVAHNRYSEVRVGLLATELLYDGVSVRQRREHTRFQIRLGAEEAEEGEMIPFRFRVPEAAMARFGVTPRPSGGMGLVEIQWQLELEVGIRWSRDLVLRVPFDVLPRSPRPGDAPTRIAPPAVGSDRLRELWTQVGDRHGLGYGEQALSARYGETALSVRRDHMGRDGIHLVAEITYPELHLALEVEPVKGLRILAGGMKVGNREWDRDHHLVARDEAQVALVLSRLLPAMEGLSLRRMDDRMLVVAVRDPGQTFARLDAFIAGASALARQTEAVRRDLPPPPALAAALPAWRALAERLGASLETARMRITAPLSTLPAEIRVAFDQKGQPMSTWLSVTSPAPIDAEHRIRVAGGATELVEARFSGEALELLRVLAEGAAALEIEAERVAVRVDALLGVAFAPDRAEQILSRMGRLVGVLRGQAGPYR